jgi:TonB family protein
MTLSVSAGIITVSVLFAFASGQVSSIPTPRKIRHAKPVYPRESLQAGDEAVVLVELTITASGTVGDSRILWSACQRLDKAALTAVRQWRYEPVQLNGKPMPFMVVANIPFRLPTQFKSRAGRAGACRWTEPQKPITE